MNLYVISQDVNDDYNTYDSAIVAAEDGDSARMTSPAFYGTGLWDGKGGYAWADAEDVVVELIGVADDSIEKGIVISSYNAG